jgi:hypothetical protein
MLMGAEGRLAFVRRTPLQRVADVDGLEHQDSVLDEDLASSLRAEFSTSRVDPARLQRAAEGAGKSTGGGGNDVVKRCRVVGVLSRLGAVMLAYRTMRSKRHGLLDGEISAPNRTALANDLDSRDVDRRRLPHRTQVSRGRFIDVGEETGSIRRSRENGVPAR